MIETTISFVILHYQSLETTIQCVDLIKKLESECALKIVIVDNDSPNKSGISLKNKYIKDDNIYIILNNNNDGFATGNNLGYKFSKEHLGSDIIVVMNNDIMIYQGEFIKKLLIIEGTSEAHILAPDIVTLNGSHQNPYRLNSISTNEIIYIYLMNTANKILYSVPLFSKIILSFNNNRKSIRKRDIINYNEEHMNIIPHGACVIYTRKWVENEDFAFVPKTFMYLEEYVLYEYLNKKNYITQFTPDISVNHLEDVSTNEVANTQLKKAKFKSKHASNSAKALLKMRLFSN